MSKLRVLVLGKNDIAVQCTKSILETDGFELVAVSPNTDDSGNDSWQSSFLKYSNEKKIKIIQFEKISSDDSIQKLRDLNLDIIFSFQYDQIITQRVIDSAKFGAINLHFAPLPKYRGVAPIAHALNNGESTFGVSLHFMDIGVDTGDIIAQSMFEISHLQNARELYDLCVMKSIELFAGHAAKIATLNFQRTPQDNSNASYYANGSFNFKEKEINLKRSSRELVNWAKAMIFFPFQYPTITIDNQEYDITAVSPDYRKRGLNKTGSIIEKTNNYAKMVTHDSFINLTLKKRESE